MALTFEAASGGLAIFTISGKLEKSELDQALLRCEKVIADSGNIKILVLASDFKGWAKASNWEDMSFAERNDPNIDKIAIVCEPDWEGLIDAFTVKDLRKVPFEYFRPSQEAQARRWLDEPE